MNFKIRIDDVTIAAQDRDTTDLKVKFTERTVGLTFEVLTTLREGRSTPVLRDLKTDGPTGSEEFAIALHEALDEQRGDLMAAEMTRICGE